MTVHVGERFLYHAEDSGFQLGGEPAKVRRDVKLDFDFAAFCETFDIPPQRGGKPSFIEHGRMKQVRDCPHFFAHVLNQIFDVFRL